MPSSVLIPAKPRPYRRYLNSALHTRFVQAAGIALLWHFCLAVLAGDWYSSVPALFWSIVSIWTVLKALLFWFSSLLVFVLLQIANLKIGRRCTPSNWTSIRLTALSKATYWIPIVYAASAWWFCEVFVFTSPISKELGWIINGGYGSPDRLNERPIYLRMLFLVLAFMHSALHIFYDYSTIPLTIDGTAREGQNKTIPARLLDNAPSILKTAGIAAGAASSLGPFLYNGVFRSTLWSWHITWAKLFASIARSEAVPPDSLYVGEIMLSAFVWSALLSVTWQLNFHLFDALMPQEPTVHTKPLSAASKDPNGTLLHGMKAKLDLTKTFTFWEFDLIANKHFERRKDIFSDFDRPSQPAVFIQMLHAGLDVVKSVQARMTELTTPQTPAPVTNPQNISVDDKDVQRLPKILPNARAINAPIFQQGSNPSGSLAERAGTYVANEAKIFGSSSNPWSPPVERTKQLAIEYSSPTIEDLKSRAEAYQQSPLGRYLLTSSIRLIKSAVLGTPTANPALTLHAISGITAFLVASLDEDTFGRAVQGVPPTVQTFTSTIFAIESFVHNHTNGGKVARKEATELKEVAILLKSLKAALRTLLDKFQGFLNDIGLSIRDLNDARKAAEDRELFEVISASKPAAEGDGHRQATNGTKQTGSREMEEVGARRQSGHRQQQEQQQQSQPQQDQRQRRRISTKDQEAEDADRSRPGRLFAQLDSGSAFSSVRERRKSVGKESNPLITRSSSSGGEMAENPFGARDFNSLPAGGLQRRRGVKA